MDVAKALGASGTRTRVVSMPCWSLFEDQGEAYQLEGEWENNRIAVQGYPRKLPFARRAEKAK